MKKLKEHTERVKEKLKSKKTPSRAKKVKKLHHKKLLRKYLDSAGYEHVNEISLTKRVFNIIVIICLLISAALLVVAAMNKPGVLGPTLMLVAVWTAVFGVLLVFCIALMYMYLGLRIFNRKLALEAVLPDFLQLTAANISAGMPIDRAMYFAIRPQFGILAKEIEEVAKSTIAGEDLGKALKKLSNKYDSEMLRRSVNLILEGIAAGGEMADLLNKISINLSELRLMKREMAANVTTYVIFISFATIFAAPFLFALSTVLADIIQKVVGSIDISSASSGLGMSLAFNADAVDIGEFKIFCMMGLSITSLFSAAIINIIRKGNIKEGIKFIPIFIFATVSLYFIGLSLLGGLFKGFF